MRGGLLRRRVAARGDERRACDRSASHDDPFGPLFNACVDQMATARTTYGVPTAEHRVTMSDGRRGIIWDVPGTPGADGGAG